MALLFFILCGRVGARVKVLNQIFIFLSNLELEDFFPARFHGAKIRDIYLRTDLVIFLILCI